MKSSSRKTKPHRKIEIYLGNEQDLYELERHAQLAGAGTKSGLVRVLNNKLKAQYRNHFTLLEQSIIEQTRLGNNELLGLFESLRGEFNDLKIEWLKLALNSLTNRNHLITATRGGKTGNARGAAVRCWFPKGHKLGSEYALSPIKSLYGDND